MYGKDGGSAITSAAGVWLIYGAIKTLWSGSSGAGPGFLAVRVLLTGFLIMMVGMVGSFAAIWKEEYGKNN